MYNKMENPKGNNMIPRIEKSTKNRPPVQTINYD
jgi:hypothetical protein